MPRPAGRPSGRPAPSPPPRIRPRLLPGAKRRERLEHERALQHRQQVEGRATREIDEACFADRRCVRLLVGVSVPQHHQAAGGRPERREPSLRRCDCPLGMLVGGGGRQDQHLVRPRALEQLGVEVGAGLPLAAADECEETCGVPGDPVLAGEPGALPTSGGHVRDPICCPWLTGGEPTPCPAGCTSPTRSSPIRSRAPRSTPSSRPPIRREAPRRSRGARRCPR